MFIGAENSREIRGFDLITSEARVKFRVHSSEYEEGTVSPNELDRKRSTPSVSFKLKIFRNP